MSQSFSAYLYREQIGSFVVNALLNGGFAWWLIQGDTLGLWKGEGAMGPDLLLTSLLLAYLLSLIVAWITRRKCMQGKIPPLQKQPLAFLQRLPSGTARLAIAVGGLGVMIGLGVVCLMDVFGIEQMARESYVIFKTLYAGALAIVCNYLAIVRVVQSASETNVAGIRIS